MLVTHYTEIQHIAQKKKYKIDRRCFSKVIVVSNVSHNITRSSDSFSTVPPIVNVGDWGCIVRDLETI